MEVEDQMPAEEKTRFEELDELKVCDRLIKRVKEGELRLVAEVAKSLRTSDPRREAVEELASATTQDILDLVRMLRESCEVRAEERECYAVVTASLECEGPEELVAHIQQLVESSLVVSEKKLEAQRLEIERLRGEVDQTQARSGEDDTIPDWARAVAHREGLNVSQLRTIFDQDTAGQRSKLSGKAKAQYEALPRDIRRGSFEGITKALGEVNRVDSQTGKVMALGKLRRLRKTEAQSIAEYCVELERLSAKAYPELDERDLDTTRAQQLYEQVVHWPESYYFLEAMEEGSNNAYARLKEVAMRVERRRLTMDNVREQRQRKAEPSLARLEKQWHTGKSLTCLKVSRMRQHKAAEVEARNESGGGRRPDGEAPPSYGPKSTTKVKILGREFSALLDTGSEISILPEAFLRQLRKEGNHMKFMAIVEVPMTEGDNEEVWVRMHVTRHKRPVLIVGTNALPALGYRLTRNVEKECAVPQENSQPVEQPQVVETGNGHIKAVVKQRAYVAPGEVKWISVTGGPQRSECVFVSGSECLYSGLCALDETGVAEVQIDVDDYKTQLIRGMRIIRDEVYAQAERYRAGMKAYYDKKQHVAETRAPEVGERVFMKLPRERGQAKHPKLACEWEGPYRVIEASENSALITRIGVNEEPVRVQFDLLLKLENDYDVDDDMHFLHLRFRCDGQPFPAVDGRPGFPLPSCRVSQMTIVSDMLPTVPPPAAEEKVECVLDAARVLAVWWGTGSISEKCRRIMDKTYLAINPKAVAVAYLFFRRRCTHVAVMSGMVPAESRLNHKGLRGWPWDTTRIVEQGWNLSRAMEWTAQAQNLVEEDQHARIVILIPKVLHRLTFCVKGPRTTLFYYRSFREIRRNNNVIFADEVGQVVIVLPPKEPDDSYSWIQLVSAVDLWFRCGAQIWMVNGPRSGEDGSWNRLNEKARGHVLGYLDHHPEFVAQWHALVPAEAGRVKASMACLRVGLVHDPMKWWDVTSAMEFYGQLCTQMQKYGLILKALQVPRSLRPAGKPLVGSRGPGSSGAPAIKDGRVSKRHLKRVEKRQERSRCRAAERALQHMSV
ncbi:unnamed protein product [Heligmosomoides polygyrus]|uniref:Peptidase A2 domain-containing protein n=1 Tax=Heligmosomoides polygyrus TaxID=6339 RepID=A0A183FVY1_HELPZ|nr:unnamed protein product [Heligmosomoides polygyrus]